MMIILGDLPSDHALRNNQLAEIRAQYQSRDSKLWNNVKPSYGIAKCTFNQLGGAWTKYDTWRVGE